MSETDFLKTNTNLELTNLIIFIKNNKHLICAFQEKLWLFYFLKLVGVGSINIFAPIEVLIPSKFDKSTKIQIISYLISVWCVLSFNDIKPLGVMIEEDGSIWINRYEIIFNCLDKLKKFFAYKQGKNTISLVKLRVEFWIILHILVNCDLIKVKKKKKSRATR